MFDFCTYSPEGGPQRGVEPGEERGAGREGRATYVLCYNMPYYIYMYNTYIHICIYILYYTINYITLYHVILVHFVLKYMYGEKC